MIYPPPQRVVDKQKALHEPDFREAPEAIAKERCGYTFDLVQAVESDDPWRGGVNAKLAFDAEGRLRVATSVRTMFGEPAGDARRYQIDYDAQGRVERWRFASPEFLQSGMVAEFAYAADGSSTVALSGGDPQVVWRSNPLAPTSGFCQYIDFDAQQRLVRERWGCDEIFEARTYGYDAQGRLETVSGRGLTDPFGPLEADLRFGEPDAWSIRFAYPSASETVITWNETELVVGGRAEVRQRIVRSHDSDGRVVRVRFDHHDDGSFDEEAAYAYAGGKPMKETRDVGADGVLDQITEYGAEGSSERIQKRNLLQAGDAAMYLYSIGHFGASVPLEQDGMNPASFDARVLQDSRHVATTPQSLGTWSLMRDAMGRVIAGTLEARAIDFTLPPPNERTIASSATQRWHALGYVEFVEVQQTRGPGEEKTRVQTTCTLTPACTTADVTLPEQPALVACDPGVFLTPQALLVAPFSEAPLLPPPLDRIEGFVRRSRYATYLSFDFASIREIVGY